MPLVNILEQSAPTLISYILQNLALNTNFKNGLAMNGLTLIPTTNPAPNPNKDPNIQH